MNKHEIIALQGPRVVHLRPHFQQALEPEEVRSRVADFPIIPAESIVVVNDHDRSTPSAAIVKALREAGKLISPVTFLVATGTHAPTPVEHARDLTGARVDDEVVVHDADDWKAHARVGRTPRGTEVRVHSLLLENRPLFTINGVEPHYFAGFTGGVKSIVPGLAARATVVQNHRWAMDPRARILETTGNPLHEDLWDAAGLAIDLDAVSSIQVINDGSHLLHLAYGQLRAAFAEARDVALRTFATALEAPVDHVVSFVEPPLGDSLYQAQKAMENVKGVLRDGGDFVLVAPCRTGLGNAAFARTIQRLQKLDRILTTLSFESYEFGDHKAYHWAHLARRARLHYVGDLEEEIVTSLFMHPLSWAELGGLVTTWVSRGDRVLIDEGGGYTTAYLRNALNSR